MRDVKDGQVSETPVQQRIDQDRRAASHVDHPGIDGDCEYVQEFQRLDRLWLVPADAIGPVALIHRVPVSSAFIRIGKVIDHADHLRARSRIT